MKFQNILVPVAGVNSDSEALELACDLSRQNKAVIWVVHVIPVARTLPLDAEVEAEAQRAENILEKMEKEALDMGCEVETDLLQAREVGPAIVDESVERKADLIIMGRERKTRFGVFNIGEAITHVLKHAPCQVLVLQQYKPE